MTPGLYDYKRRYRQRLLVAITRISLCIVTIVIGALFSYKIGVQQTTGEQLQLHKQVIILQNENKQLRNQKIELEAATVAVQVQLQTLQDRFNAEVPQGSRRELDKRIAERLREGVEEARLRFFIDAAGPARNCTNPTTHKFILPTPTYRGSGNTSAVFGDGKITVTGIGTAARSENGTPQPWFDPTQEVMIIFTPIGGAPVTTTRGTLPLHHSVALGDAEYRFSVSAAERSVVVVTSDRCMISIAGPSLTAPIPLLGQQRRY
jgi:hypothetical protein